MVENNIVDPIKMGLMPELIKAYLERDERLKDFYLYSPDQKGILDAVSNKRVKGDRIKLVKALNQQYADVIISKGVQSNIDRLLDAKTFTITTGHQLCIATGPLFMLEKIAHVIRLSEELNNAQSENYFVPVFWMASEDHDWDEVNEVNLFNQSLKSDFVSNTTPVGKIKNTEFTDLIDQIEAVLGERYSGELWPIFKKAYEITENLADATRLILNDLFGERGLVIIDGDDAVLKGEFSSIIRTDILDPSDSERTGNVTNNLKKEFHSQLKISNINYFTLTNSERLRLNDSGGSFITEEAKYSTNDLIELLENSPEKFSPNAATRPIYQEYVLPNVCYVGGPGELSYWLQLKPLFEKHNVDFPALMLRQMFLLLNKGVVKKLKSNSISIEDVFMKTKDELIKEKVKEEGTFSSLHERELLEEAFNKLKERAVEIDANLEKSVEAEKAKSLKAIDTIESKVLRSMKRNNDQLVNQISAIFDTVFPHNSFQERHDNVLMHEQTFPEFSCVNDFIDAINDPFKPSLNVITPSETP